MERSRAKDPDTPIEELCALIQYFPEEVQENPVLALLSIEDPAKWVSIQQELEATLQEYRLREGLSWAEQRILSLFAADCIEQMILAVEKILAIKETSKREVKHHKAVLDHAKSAVSQLRSSPEEVFVLSKSPTWKHTNGCEIKLPDDMTNFSEVITKGNGRISEINTFILAQGAANFLGHRKQKVSARWLLERLEMYLGKKVSLPQEISWYRLPPEEQAKHPKTPVAALQNLDRYQDALLENPALLAQDASDEAKQLWGMMRGRQLQENIQSLVRKLPPPTQHRLAVECAERVEVFLQDPSLREKATEFLTLLRLSLKQPIPPEALQKMAHELRELVDKHKDDGDGYPTSHALRTLLHSCRAAEDPHSAEYSVYYLILTLWTDRAKPYGTSEVSIEQGRGFHVVQEEMLKYLEKL